jgi:ornithine cyclodeaminase/alanine dehydrogenase-like protein (mu-crystallin family)
VNFAQFAQRSQISFPTAGSALATVLLYSPVTDELKHLVAFGAGSQIRTLITQPLTTYRCITIVNRTTRSDPDGGEGRVESAVREADCVCCATPSTTPLFPSEWVRPGNTFNFCGELQAGYG